MSIPFTIIKLDKDRKLRFGMMAMVEFEKITGVKLTAFDSAMSMDITSQMLWIMLKQYDDTLTLEQTIKLVDDNADDMTYIIDKVGEAVTIAFGEEDDQKNAATPTPKSPNT